MSPALRRLLALPIGVTAQFGGGGFGGGGFGGGYEPPAPICPAVKCAKDEVAAPKLDYQIWTYGCKESGMNIFSAGANFDPSDPMKGMKQGQKNLDKCCVERDICRQTCGMTSKACHEAFQKCQKKICKGDQNCNLQAMIADISTEPPAEELGEPEVGMERCKAYNYHQKNSCQCVPKADGKNATEQKLQWFYGKFNPEKLDGDGNIKDVEEVWKKWKGKESDMFMALAVKYKEKAVDRREKPKPNYDAPKDTAETFSAEADAEEVQKEVKAEPKELDELDEAFEKARRKLEIKKTEAAEDEKYDEAQEAKDEAEELVKKEVERLKKAKAKAIEDETFEEAKRLKKRLASLEL